MRSQLGVLGSCVASIVSIVALIGATARPTAAPTSPTGEIEYDYGQAVALQRSDRHVESLPWFRSVVQARPEIGSLHLDYGMALHNASIQTDSERGAVRFVVPTAQARAALRREALREIDLAIREATSDDERAFAWYMRSNVLEVAGELARARESLEQALTLRPIEPQLQSARLRQDRRLAGK